MTAIEKPGFWGVQGVFDASSASPCGQLAELSIRGAQRATRAECWRVLMCVPAVQPGRSLCAVEACRVSISTA